MNLLDVLSAPWAIVPDKLIELQGIYAAHLRGDRADLAAIEARIGKPLDNPPQGYAIEDRVAVIALEGVIAKRANLFSAISGGASSQLFARDVRQALADPKVDAILVEIDSPGGAVDGTQAAAQALASARGVKPVAAIADGTIASAAYWIGAQAEHLYLASDTTIAGSIGVVGTHVDVSRAEEQRGRKTTEIVAGRYKRIASAYGPLSDEGRAVLQDQIDQIYAVFVDAVAAARGVSVDKVLADMADGRLFIGKKAVTAGLADGVASREAVMRQLRDRVRPARAPKSRQEASMPEDQQTLSIVVAAADTAAAAAALDTQHPALARHLRAQGASAERARIQGVEAQSLPGHEALIAGLKFDGQTTGPEAAVAVLNAERAASAAHAAALAADAPAPLPFEPTHDAVDAVVDPRALAADARKRVEAARADGRVITVTQAMAELRAGAIA